MKKRLLLIVFSIIAVTAVVLAGPTIKQGFDTYTTAVAEKSVLDKYNEHSSQSNYLKLIDVPDQFIEMLLRSEDKRFYIHPGFDPIAISRAVTNNIKQRRFAEGGSTITQQLAKNLYYSFDKTLERKVAELFTAIDIENQLSKEQILELYINVIYYGEQCYGLQAAAEHYYGVTPSELSIKQSMALVRTIKRPNDFNPNAMAVLQQQNQIIYHINDQENHSHEKVFLINGLYLSRNCQLNAIPY